MSIKINYSNKISNKSLSNIVLFCNEKYNINGLKNYLSNSEYSYINDLLKTIDLKKSLFVFDINSKKKIILISIKNNLKTSDFENLGAEFCKQINLGKNKEYFIFSDTISGKYDNFLGYFLHGLKLKSYEFKKYKTKKDTRIILVNIIGIKNKPSIQGKPGYLFY